MTAPKKFIAIVAPHFTAGVEIGGKVAPIVHYMKQWDEAKILSYCRSKGWKVIDVEKEVARTLT